MIMMVVVETMEIMIKGGGEDMEEVCIYAVIRMP